MKKWTKDHFLKDKVVLITGAAGTIGRNLIEKVRQRQPLELRVLDNNESEIFLFDKAEAIADFTPASSIFATARC